MPKSLLLVEDDIETRVLLARFIERNNFVVFQATTAEQGIELYKEHNPDCVFLDVHLPGMDGIEAYKKIKEINPNPIIYFITGVSTEDISLEKQVMEMGATGYMGKPITLEDILKVLKTI